MTSSILISALVTVLIVVLIVYLIDRLPIEGRLKQIARLIVVILGIISLIRLLGVV